MEEQITEKSRQLARLEDSPIGSVIRISLEVAKKFGETISKFSKNIIGLIFK